MAEIKAFAKGSSLYFVSNVVVVLAGLISLPVWTRLFSAKQYGLFALCNVTVTFAVAISKFGLQHAALRFYSDVRAGKIAVTLRSYYTTMLLGGAGLSLAVTLAIAVAARLLFISPDNPLAELVAPVAAVIVVQAVISVLMIFLRAEQRAKLHSLITVVHRYARFGLALLVVLALGARVRNLYLGTLLASVLLVLLLVWRLLRRDCWSLRAFSLPLLGHAVVYGFPLIWLEVSNAILNIGDRYVLQYYLGASAVGTYSVGYNASQMAASLLIRPLRLAVVPMYLALWNEQGREVTREFLSKALMYYAALGVPLAMGISWFRTEIVTLLATEKFLLSAEIVPYVIVSLVIHGGYAVYAAGLYIWKKTTILMFSTLAAAVLNVGLNLLLVPTLGLRGAALATLVAYVTLSVWIWYAAGRRVNVRIDWWFLGKVTASSLASIAVASAVATRAPTVLKIGLVILLYGLLMLALDSETRRMALRMWSSRRS